MIVKGRAISKGKAEGEVLLSRNEISFLGDVDPKTGVVTEKKSDIYKRSIAGKILVFPRGRGSTVGPYVLYQLKKNKKAPKAIINLEAEIIVAVGAIISSIPMVDKLEKDPFEFLKNGDVIKVDGDEGVIEVVK
jgi:hypothetical protein